MEREKREKLLAAINDFGEAFKDVSDEEFERELANAQSEARAKLQVERTRKTRE